MSKRRLISLILVLMLTLTLVFGLISCNRRGDDGQTEKPTEDEWRLCEHVFDNACDAECNKCGEIRVPADHVYDNACDVDCNVCGETRTPAAHVEKTILGKAATCTEDGLTDGIKCSVCGIVITEQKVIPSVHNYDNACDADCNICGETRIPADHKAEVVVGKAATCTEDGLTDGIKCSVCGIVITEQKVIPAAHTYDNACDADCNICGETRIPADHKAEVVVGKAPTCTEDGLKDGGRCSECGYEIKAQETIPALGHDWNSVFEKDAVNHWKACTRCDETDGIETHTFENSVCTVCGYGCEHAAERVWSTDREATCALVGRETATCAACNAVVESRNISKLPHTPGAEATCTEVQTCTVCGEVTTPALGHKPGDDATCTAAQTCTVCQEVIAPALGHVGGEAASCVRPQTCNRCGEVLVPAKGHTYSSDCDALCNECGDTRSDVADHTEKTVEAVAPTCTTNGYTEGKICSVCGEILKKQEIVRATGHSYDNACDADCNTCGTVRTPAEHIYSNNCDIDCNECGFERDSSLISHTYDNECDADCNNCGAIREAHLFDGACDTTCSICGYERIADSEHVYTNACDDTCNVCGEKRVAGHTYDNACDGVCNECGEKRNARHNYSSEWTSNTNSHWQECSVCGARQLRAAHTYTNTCDADCDVCGARRTPADHVYDNKCDTTCNVCFSVRQIKGHDYISTYDEVGHWEICSECGAKTGKVGHSYKDGVCSCGRKQDPCDHNYANDCTTVCAKCGEVREPAADHIYSENADRNSHWLECSVCSHIKNTQNHTFITVSVDDLKHSVQCIVCGYESHEASHAFIDGICSCGYESVCDHTGGEATCNQLAVCENCGCEYGRYAAHTESVVNPEIPASCMGDGATAAIQCSVCNKWIQEPKTIPAFGHTIVETAGKAPTCTDTGLTVGKTCSVCGYTASTQEIIPVIEHAYQKTAYTAPTCEINGSASYICVYCGTTKNEIVVSTGHNASDWVISVAATCTEPGSKAQYCKDCGTELVSEIINASGHKYGEGVITAPTCVAGGYTTSVCAVCKNISVSDNTIPTGHTWGLWITDRDATCTVEGRKHQECETCGVWGNVTPIIAEGSHKWSSTLKYNSNGHWHQCSECGEISDYGDHVWANECDTTCDICGQTRTIRHTYDNDCDTTCNTCGDERTVTHRYYQTYESDSSKHWQSCSVCGAKRNESPHVYDGSDDTECNTCGYNRSVSHNFSDSYTNNETHHWYACTDAGCDAITGKTTHKYTNNCDSTCNDCGYERQVTHTFGTAWSKDEDSHWHVCLICQTPGASSEHTWDNGCDTNCNDCGYQREAEHQYDDECDSECNICGKTRTVPHLYGDSYWKDANQHWYQCANCGVTKGAANHSYDNNCDEYCNVCNYHRDVQHNYGALWIKDESQHWHACTTCGVKQDVAAHDYSNACDTTCDTCGQTRTVGDHNWSTSYISNASYHWYRCTSCGQEKDKGLHKFDSVCDSECNVCGYERTGTSHEYSTSLDHDSISHWYACTKCGTKNNEVRHVYDNDCDTTCNTSGCGYVRSISHKYDESYASNGTHHWQACSVCGTETNKASHAWSNTCDSQCDVCGYTRTTTHSYSVTYSSDADQHWYACIVCKEKSNAQDHVWANDCDTDCNICGYTRKTEHQYDNTCDTTCNICGAPRTITHSWSSTWSKDDTYHWYECTVCGAKKSTATHNYSGATDTTCDSCGHTRDLAACSHVYDNDCGDATCNKCGATRTSFPADHTFTNNCDTTCDVCGTVARTASHTYQYGCSTTCTICNATRSASHSYSSSYSMDADNHWKECVYGCGAVQGSKVKHEYSISCDPTCDTCGYTRVTDHTWDESSYKTDGNYHWYQCTVCGTPKDKNAHNFTNSCDTDCGVCGYIRSIKHSYGSSYTTDASSHWYQCTVCGNKTELGSHKFVLTSISNTQHTKACSVCKFVASTDSHVFDENNKCQCGAEKVIIETYATSVDYINLNGPYSGYGSNSVKGVSSVKGHGTDLYGKLSIKGWCVTDSGIAGYYYSIDGGKTWIAIDTTGCLQDATDAHISYAAGSVGISSDAPRSNCVISSPLTIDLSEHWGETFDIIFAAQAVSGVYVNIITLEDVTVWNPQAQGRPVVKFDHANGLVNGYAIDKVSVNGTVWSVNANVPDGIAMPPYGQNHTAISIKSGEFVTLSGWLGYKSKTINTFGYFYADNPGAVTLSSSYAGTAEDAVLNASAGGANAKRYVIDVDTTNLSDGVHRLYFVVQLSDGTICIIQYLDVYVTGKDDDYVEGSDVADSQVIVASKDTTSNFSTAPVSMNGNTYTMYAGLTFNTTAAYNAGTYRFTVPASGITLTFPDGQFSEFNRFKLQYSASACMKAVIRYVDKSGNIRNDTVYLEGGQGTFTCLVEDYINHGTAKDIDSITLYPLGTTSAAFMLAHVSTEMYTWYIDNMTYIQNARFKIGVKMSWGGSLSYFEDKNDGIPSVRNLINIYDEGRLIQQSWYNSGVQTGNYNGTKWKYNPVQGGDWRGNDSRIIDIVMEDFSLYIKAQPMDWGAGTDGQTATITPSYMENWYTVYSDRLRVDNRFVDYSGYAASGVCNQEVPAMYFIGWLNSFAYDAGSGDWNSVNYAYKTNLPFWSGGSGNDNVYDPNYAVTTRFAVSGSETWGAWYNQNANFGIGFYTPGVKRFISGRNLYNKWGDTTSPFSAGCSYTAAGTDVNLQSFKAYTYSYLLTTGSVQSIRATFAKYANFVTNSFS